LFGLPGLLAVQQAGQIDQGCQKMQQVEKAFLKIHPVGKKFMA